ncbi:MAG: DUF2461 domain-containing protein [Epsilonproteobacteria bacterium]|nr:DUF2461 domain-containing protein [Campylobacterota bacterium]OIO14931.1 MAG: TIGR02453 family protein [Helicobacteraceae bacterium CG1_02_36_14]PIP10850.1 MAG: TIGR02453 family protein [Sulfurimonas sp. CG23_combo_of_CG06-09_8_20_14_all_36_33]PIS26709.1 MAG: TIGR02453 family protein [Sulfurimonas sp. CG08_land_8_20_14_0_20_36_33]PIU35027.1 MAG: TIGR02453 family protein [Sulfurimonas sp. CG07_land_8_20_14_0_80_36_56]PIV03272.1 MAG: TIGR02453 family protein [Sulfurimonas sp. CG03_land_8_20_1
MEFKGFSKKTVPFLSSIRKNNNKEWFEAHKSEYENLILNPSRLFVQEMGEHLQALEPTINATPKINKSLFRIYRDTRRMGSKKEPLKSRIGIIFWQGNASRLQSSSFYLHFSPDELFVAVGVRWFEKPLLDAYREYILDDERREKLAGVLEEILACGYEVIPKGYKRFPKGFSAELPHAKLSLYKGMATYKILDPKLIEDGDLLIDTLYKIYEDMLPLQQIMYEISMRVEN